MSYYAGFFNKWVGNPLWSAKVGLASDYQLPGSGSQYITLTGSAATPECFDCAIEGVTWEDDGGIVYYTNYLVCQPLYVQTVVFSVEWYDGDTDTEFDIALYEDEDLPSIVDQDFATGASGIVSVSYAYASDQGPRYHKWQLNDVAGTLPKIKASENTYMSVVFSPS